MVSRVGSGWKSFDFKWPDESLLEKAEFSSLDKEADDRQVNTLPYCMGEDAQNVLSSTGISDEDKKYDKVVEKVDLNFSVRHNVIYESTTEQYESDSAEIYISESN